MKRNGFTIVESAVVGGIVMVLAAVLIVNSNPVDLLKQARDSERSKTLLALENAINIYIADASSGIGAEGVCYASSVEAPATPACGGQIKGTSVTATSTTPTDMRGKGWIPVAFSSPGLKSDFNNEPLDPTNDGHYFYAYAAHSAKSTFKLTARFESEAYKDIAADDGGDDPAVYEVGTLPGLKY